MKKKSDAIHTEWNHYEQSRPAFPALKYFLQRRKEKQEGFFS